MREISNMSVMSNYFNSLLYNIIDSVNQVNQGLYFTPVVKKHTI